MSLVRAVRLKLERNPDLRLRIGREISPQHADNRVRLTAQRKRLSNNLRISAKPPLPQAVAQHHHVAAVRRVLLLRESAAQHHRRAEHAEVALRHVNAVDQLRPVSRDVESRSREIVRRHILEDRSLPLPLLELRNRRARRRSPADDVSRICTIRSASGYPSGFSSTAFTTVKIAVFAPMPRASADTAAIVNPGLLMNRCSACFTSFQRSRHVDNSVS